MLKELFTIASITSLMAATIRLMTPILLASLGEIYTQRAGILNLGLEGSMTAGALFAFLGMYFTDNLAFAALCGVLGGMLLNALMGFLSITMKANQVIAGTGITILATGLCSFIYRTVFGIKSMPPQVRNFTAYEIPLLSKIPVVGPALFSQNALVYIAIILMLVCAFGLKKTTLGLKIKAVGEHPRAADSKGINVYAIRYTAILIGGALAGLGGAFLTLGYMNVFMDGIVAGMGYIAVAVVVFAKWNPYMALAGSAIFGFANALQLRLQAMGVPIPSQFLLMLPYVLTIVAMISVSKKAEFPAAYTKAYSRMER